MLRKMILLSWTVSLGSLYGQTPPRVASWQAVLDAACHSQPDNPSLHQLSSQMQAFHDAYVQAVAASVSSSTSATCSMCPICQQEHTQAALLQRDCAHVACDVCTLGYLAAHQGTPRAWHCWEPQCEVPLDLESLGGYLGQHQREDLYLAAAKQLLRQAEVGAEFCPHCGEGMTLPSAEHGHGATCTVCARESCFACGKPAHGEIPCARLEDTQTVFLLALRQIALSGQAHLFGLCPHCEVLSEHRDGCDAMTCGQNAADKQAIRFKGDFVQEVSSRQQTRRGTAGCGRAFNWHRRISIGSYLAEHDPQWQQRHHVQLEAAAQDQVVLAPSVMGQRLSRAQLDRRLDAGRSIAGADLRGIDLAGLNLTVIRFDSCLLDNAQVRYLLRYGGRLKGANLRETILDLEGFALGIHSLARTRLGRQQMVELLRRGQTNFVEADFSHADLRQLALTGINLTGAIFLETQLRAADMSHTRLARANFRSAHLMEANLRGADLRDANLRYADLRSADLRRANLTGASFVRTDLVGADLRDVNLAAVPREHLSLVGVRLTGQQLQAFYQAGQRNFAAAKLRGADLRGMDLSGIELVGADLRGAGLRGAKLRDANLLQADLRGADLREASFARANLEGANLQHTHRKGTSFVDANLLRARLTHPFVRALRGLWHRRRPHP